MGTWKAVDDDVRPTNDLFLVAADVELFHCVGAGNFIFGKTVSTSLELHLRYLRLILSTCNLLRFFESLLHYSKASTRTRPKQLCKGSVPLQVSHNWIDLPRSVTDISALLVLTRWKWGGPILTYPFFFGFSSSVGSGSARYYDADASTFQSNGGTAKLTRRMAKYSTREFSHDTHRLFHDTNRQNHFLSTR